MTYQELDDDHLAASVETIRNVCAALTPPGSQQGGRPTYYRVGHFEHGSMLTHNLYGFSVLSLTRDEVPARAFPGLDELSADFPAERLARWCTPEEASDLVNPTVAEVAAPMATDETHPVMWAIVANQSLSDQITALLRGVATLIGRTGVVDEGLKKGNVRGFSPAALRADRSADALVRDSIRGQGWRATAEQLMSQAAMQDIRLNVTYSAPLISAKEVARRVPLCRFAYNSFGAVRDLVDRTAAVMATGMRLRGDASASLMRMADDLTDSTQTRRYLAHVIRDSIVCGNGLLYWGENPAGDLRLIRPESLREIGSDAQTAYLDDPDFNNPVRNIFHLTGSDQVDSSIGASTIEPFVRLASDRALFLAAYLEAGILQSAPSAKRHSELQRHAESLEATAQEQLDRIEESALETIGAAASSLPPPPHDLYFSGFQRMEPAVTRVELSSEIQGSAGAS